LPELSEDQKKRVSKMKHDLVALSELTDENSSHDLDEGSDFVQKSGKNEFASVKDDLESLRGDVGSMKKDIVGLKREIGKRFDKIDVLMATLVSMKKDLD
jgi:hypothetical protein